MWDGPHCLVLCWRRALSHKRWQARVALWVEEGRGESHVRSKCCRVASNVKRFTSNGQPIFVWRDGGSLWKEKLCQLECVPSEEDRPGSLRNQGGNLDVCFLLFMKQASAKTDVRCVTPSSVSKLFFSLYKITCACFSLFFSRLFPTCRA